MIFYNILNCVRLNDMSKKEIINDYRLLVHTYAVENLLEI